VICKHPGGTLKLLLTSSGISSDEALGLVDFSVFPHRDREDGIPASPPEEIEAWAAGLSVPAHVIYDQAAIKVVDGTVEVVSEGHWKLLTANESR
jgi:dipeptidase E